MLLEDISSLCFPKIDLGFVREYYYSILEFVEPKLYIFEAPPLVMVIESVHNIGIHFLLSLSKLFWNAAILLM